MSEAKNITTWIYKIPTPKTQSVKFEETFKNTDQPSKEIFKKITFLREELKKALDLESSYQAAINASEAYLPYLFGLLKSAESFPPEFSKWLRLIWTTPFTIRYSTSPFVYSSLQWEVVMVLLGYAISLRNLASDTISVCSSAEFEEKTKVAANLLTKAASILNHIHDKQLSKWAVKPDIYLAEAKDETFMALSSVCVAEAQELSIKKALLKSMSNSTVSKLCMDVSQKYEYAFSVLKDKATEILPPYLNYLDLNTYLWKAQSYRFLAEDENSQGHIGKAIALLKVGYESLVEKRDIGLEQFLTYYNSEKQSIKKQLDNLTNENDSIYYEKVPSQTELPLIEPKCIMKVSVFEPSSPQSVPITFVKSSDCCIQ